MARILTDLGEEFTLKNNMEGVAVIVGLYNDSTDTITDTDDLAQVTTEPSDGNYTRQSATLTLTDDGDWAAVTSAQTSFDVTSTTGNVDSYFVVANFQATDTGDGTANDHLIGTGALSQSRDLSQIDTLNISAGNIGVKLT